MGYGDVMTKIDESLILESPNVSEERKEIIRKVIALRGEEGISYVVFGGCRSRKNDLY